MELNDRIEELLKHQRLTSSQFADNIGVQRSSMSHILSGRNKPSLDFVQKVLEHFKFINSDWLLFGKGSMTKEMKQQSLFDLPESGTLKPNIQSNTIQAPQNDVNQPKPTLPLSKEVMHTIAPTEDGEIERIVIFFKNGSFKTYSRSN